VNKVLHMTRFGEKHGIDDEQGATSRIKVSDADSLQSPQFVTAYESRLHLKPIARESCNVQWSSC
jgi:hypothetical protein